MDDAPNFGWGNFFKDFNLDLLLRWLEKIKQIFLPNDGENHGDESHARPGIRSLTEAENGETWNLNTTCVSELIGSTPNHHPLTTFGEAFGSLGMVESVKKSPKKTNPADVE